MLMAVLAVVLVSALGYVLVNALMFGGQFAFISGSSFVLIGVLGLSPSVFGLCFGGVAFGIMTGTFLSGRFGGRIGLDDGRRDHGGAGAADPQESIYFSRFRGDQSFARES